MKTRTIMWVILLIICNTPLLAEHYYYYHGEKIPLIVSTDSVTIYATLTNMQISNPSDSIIISTVPIEMVNQISVQENIDILSIEYLIGDSIATQKMSNSFYIKLHEYADTLALKELVQETNTHLLGEIPYVDKWYEVMVANSLFNNTLDMSNYFFETGLFADVDPGFVFEVTPHCVSDSEFALQWALPSINACEAWGYTKGDPNLVVAVIDDGIHTEHPEFANTRFVYPYDCHTDQEINTTYSSHGTLVAGVMIANHNMGQVAGIAPEVTIMPISHPLDTTTRQAAKELASGISHAWKHGADVINCSWGFHPKKMTFPFLYSRVLENALEDALTYGRDGKGCVIVFASGNIDFDKYPFYDKVFYPSNCISELLVVGALTSDFNRREDTSFGEALDVVAPGDMILTTNKNNEDTIAGGTSLAAPYVSGIAALILSVNPNLQREEVVSIIESTARSEGFGPNYIFNNESNRSYGPWCEQVGYGLVDAHAAVEYAANMYIQNKIYSVPDGPAVERAHTIYAGYAVTDSKAYGNVSLRISTEVSYLATNKVVLKSGFHAHAGSNLHVKIVDYLSDPIATTSSAPQRMAARSSSATTDDTESTNDSQTNNTLEDMGNNMIQSTTIYTISGQLIQTISGGQHDAVQLPNGMYVLQHRMSDGSVRSEKIVNSR